MPRTRQQQLSLTLRAILKRAASLPAHWLSALIIELQAMLAQAQATDKGGPNDG